MDIVAIVASESSNKSERKSDSHQSKTSINQFDFTAVVNAFDQVWAVDSTSQHWSAAQSLADAQLNEDDAAYGSEAFRDVSLDSVLLGQRAIRIGLFMNFKRVPAPITNTVATRHD